MADTTLTKIFSACLQLSHMSIFYYWAAADRSYAPQNLLSTYDDEFLFYFPPIGGSDILCGKHALMHLFGIWKPEPENKKPRTLQLSLGLYFAHRFLQLPYVVDRASSIWEKGRAPQDCRLNSTDVQRSQWTPYCFFVLLASWGLPPVAWI